MLALPLLAGAAPREALGAEYTFTEEKSIVLEPGSTISVNNVSGDILIQGWEKDKVLITSIKRVKARDRKQAEQWAKKVDIIIEKSNQNLFIEGKRPKEWTESLGSLLKGIFEKKPSVSIDFEIYTPSEVELEISSVSGDIFVDDIIGDVLVDVVSGDVEISEIGADVSIDIVSGDLILENIAGDLDIDAVSGDADVRSIGGDLHVDVTSGDITGDDVIGDLTVDGTSGDVTFREVHGDVHIDVTSGDIYVLQKAGDLWIDTSSGDVTVETITELAGRYVVETSSGQISFRIPSSASSSVELETSGGKIKAKVPMTIETVSRTHLVGTVGDGEGEIILSTSGGDIELLPFD
jgi:lia operon protein LiaG